MNKISLLLAFLLFGITAGFSQDLEDISNMIAKKEFVKAKESIDKYMAEPKNASKADGWYYKGWIYNAYSNEQTVSTSDAYKLKSDAFDALKKYQELDPKEIRTQLELWVSFLHLYNGLFDLGVMQFNSQYYENAFTTFLKDLEVKDYILQKKYVYATQKVYPLDTALVLNLGASANMAKDEANAVKYYKILTDANVSEKYYQPVYEFMADYYSRTNNSVALAEILPRAKMHFPETDYWYEVELKNAEKNGGQSALFAKYDELIPKDPTSYYLLYTYAVEIYNGIYSPKDDKFPNELEMKEKLTNILKQTIPTDTAIDATLLMSNHLFNWASDYSTAAGLTKGTKPEDVKKRNELNSLANKKIDEFIPYADAVLNYLDRKPTLTNVQKATYRGVAANLTEVYSVKGDKKKAAEYDQKGKAPDKKM